MKQQYRYTKPYRGKDPNFEKEELIENENNDNLQRRLKAVSYTHLTLPTICSV